MITNYTKREGVSLASSNGNTEILADVLPKDLRKPLSLGSSGLGARRVDSMTAVVSIDKNNYTLKGCNPQENYFSLEQKLPYPFLIDYEYDDKYFSTMLNGKRDKGTPIGSLSLERANKELINQSVLVKILGEFNLVSPNTPLARYDYEQEGCHCAISSSRENCSLEDFFNTVSLLSKVPKGYKEQFKRVHQWLGFANYLIVDMDVSIDMYQNDINNFVLYRLDEGWGVSRSNLGMPRNDEEPFLTNDMRGSEEHLHIVDILKKEGVEEKAVESEGVILELHNSDKLECEDYFGQLLIRLPEKDFVDYEKTGDYFLRGFEGEPPKPISDKFVSSVLNC